MNSEESAMQNGKICTIKPKASIMRIPIEDSSARRGQEVQSAMASESVFCFLLVEFCYICENDISFILCLSCLY